MYTLQVYKRKHLFKKIIIGLISVIFITTCTTTSKAEEQKQDIMEITRNAGYKVDEFYRPKAAILIDAQTGKLLWEENSSVVRHIASMSKLMTIYVVLEEMGNGNFNQDTELEVTQKYVDIASDYNLSNNKIVLGVKYSIREMLDLIFVPSSNAATLMLADFVSDSDPNRFVQMMNDTAQKIGMTNTKYYNCTGTLNRDLGTYMPAGNDPEADNESTAHDLSLLAFHLLKKHPDVLEHTKNPTITVKEGTPYAETFNSYLFSLPGKTYGYEGFDGIKTGSSMSAGFNYVGTAKRDNTRFIQVIMGVGDWDHQESEEARHPFGNALLDFAFNRYEYRTLLNKGKTTLAGQEIDLTEDLVDLVEKNKEPDYELVDGKVQVKTELPLINEQLTVPSATYKAEKGSAIAKETVKKEKIEKRNSLIAKVKSLKLMTYTKIGLIALAFLLLLLLIMDVIFTTGRRSRKINPLLSPKFFIMIASLIIAAVIQFLKLG